MALYVAICLLAALVVVGDADLEQDGTLFGLIWGTTIGLVVAHLFAFRLAARLVAAGTLRRADAELAAAQLAGSALVAALASVPVVLLEGDAELAVTSAVLAVFIGLVGYLVARRSGASMLRSAAYGSATTVLAIAVVEIKNALAGH